MPVTFWAIAAPSAGTWQIVVPAPTGIDSIRAYGFTAQRSFTLTSVMVGDSLEVKWNSLNASTGSTVDIYLDEDSSGYGGELIATIPESAGAFRYKMGDHLPACSYRVYAVRIANEVMTRTYAPGSVTNPKTFLPPLGFQTKRTSDTTMRLMWTPNDSLSTHGYQVKLTTKGIDSVIGFFYPYEDNVTIHVPKGFDGLVSIAAVDTASHVSCWALATAASMTSAQARRLSGVNVFPNPAGNHTHVRFELKDRGSVSIQVFDALGRTVLFKPARLMDAGPREIELDLSTIPHGWYTVRVATSDMQFAPTVFVK
jgi:hypothetical protein